MYDAYFGLTRPPFRLTPDPAFLFPSAQHKKGLAYLDYGLHKKEGFTIITGDVGTGKTLVAQAFLAKISSGDMVTAQIASAQLSPKDLLVTIAAAFGLPELDTENGKGAIINTLQSYFRALCKSGRRAVLVVDEAHNLSPETIEELCVLANLQVEGVVALQVFLVGQTSLLNRLNLPDLLQLKQRVVGACHLGPFDMLDTRRYVEHRLKLANWNNTKPAIEDSAFGAVYAMTNGVPREINTLADRLLLDCYLHDRQSVSAEDVQRIAAELATELGGHPIRPLSRVIPTQPAQPPHPVGAVAPATEAAPAAQPPATKTSGDVKPVAASSVFIRGRDQILAQSSKVRKTESDPQ